jgi:hypothetical protein
MSNNPNLSRRFAFIINNVVADCIYVDDVFAAIFSQNPLILELKNTEVMPGWNYDEDNSYFSPPLD